MIHSFITILLFILASCVGTVEDRSAAKTDFFDPPTKTFKYNGIVEARAISHNKIEIDFYPAGDETNFRHFLSVNDTNQPVEIKLDTVPRLDGGLYRYTLTDLTINTSYTLEITAQRISDGAISTEEYVAESINTFDNTTANFSGIASVEAIPGASSSEVVVKWNPADFKGAIIAAPTDVAYYEVLYISEGGGQKNLNNSNYAGSDRLKIRVPGTGYIGVSNHPKFTTVTGLVPDTNYYFQVRAIQKAWEDLNNADSTNVPIKKEQNSLYVAHKTSPVLNYVDFNKDSLRTENSPGKDAFTKVRLNWTDGVGNYTGYRIFVTEYSGNPADAQNDDELTKNDLDPSNGKLNACVSVAASEDLVTAALDATAKSDPTKIGCFDVPAITTNVEISNLVPYTSYHFKVALCQDATCAVQDGAPNQAILSNIKFDYTEPILAPFVGINFVNQPQDAASLQSITMDYDPPIVSQGYVDSLEIYCIDPDNFSSYSMFPEDSSAITGSSVSRCNGLNIETVSGAPLSTVSSYNTISNNSRLKVVGTKTVPDPDARYCFAITPAIKKEVSAPAPVRKPASQWVVRCLSPEVKVPNIDEFAGIKNSCVVNANSFTVSWDTPSGGIYSDYSLFYKKKNNFSFNFGEAIGGNASYTKIDSLSTLSHTVSSLEPGKIYEVGVLTRASDGGVDYYSEPNINIVECEIPMPKATFTEWTRVFAIGPKIDGRVPTIRDPANSGTWPVYRTGGVDGNSADESRIYEALSEEGIPYEVDLNAGSSGFYTAPPGDQSISFVFNNNESFDAAAPGNGIAASNTGIVSLAWKQVDLDFMLSEFSGAQASHVSSSVPRTVRDFGYKVYRSSDFGLKWENLTPDRVISAIDYSYHIRANEPATTEKMAFFTDYTVENLSSVNDVERARIYLYKIVPVYAGQELKYNGPSSSPHHIITVTLPPANMALVHRYMANRNTCYELNKDDELEKDQNYRCPYNGLGAKQRGFPWQLGDTVVDLGGDLLVDRFALGCNFTRGDKTPGAANSYKTGNSYFSAPSGASYLGARSRLADFLGKADNGSNFKGCTKTKNNTYAPHTEQADPYGGVDPEYDNLLIGDCVGSDAASSYSSANVQYEAKTSSNYPGLYTTTGLAADDPSIVDPDDPHFAYGDDAAAPGLLDRNFRRNFVAQGEQFAVFYNGQSSGGNRDIAIYGPGFDSSTTHNKILSEAESGSCRVNLASIGSEGWRSRWFPVIEANSVPFFDDTESSSSNHTVNLHKKTLDEIHSSRALYDDGQPLTNYLPPAKSTWDLDRIDGSMPMARVYSSNAAKLPALKLSLRDAQKVCGLYKVQPGIQSGGASFSATAAPLSKRLLRRNEFVASAAFPEVYDSDKQVRVENGSDSTAYQVNGQDLKSCVGSNKAISQNFSYVAGETLDSDVFMTGTDTKEILTGSGGDDVVSSESCTSRYGIQDLVGNRSEHSPEVLFCDFAEESQQIYFGQAGSRTNSVPYPFADDRENDKVGVLANAPIYFPGRPNDASTSGGNWSTYDDDMDGNPDGMVRTGNSIWKFVSATSGYCSIVDNDRTRVENSSNFRDASGIFTNLFNSDGTLNQSVSVRTEGSDPASRDDLRNGDGFFLNFGEANLAPSMRLGGSLSIGNSFAKFFNPVVGIPLDCDNYAGGFPSCGSNASDNQKISLSDFWANFPGANPTSPAAPGGLDVEDFPIANSNFSSVGVTDTSGGTAVNTSTIGGTGRGSGMYITEVSSNGNYEFVKESDYGSATTVNFYNMKWKLERGEKQYFRNGGSGRFGLGMATTDDVNDGVKFRCGVLINEDF